MVMGGLAREQHLLVKDPSSARNTVGVVANKGTAQRHNDVSEAVKGKISPFSPCHSAICAPVRLTDKACAALLVVFGYIALFSQDCHTRAQFQREDKKLVSRIRIHHYVYVYMCAVAIE